MRCQNELPFENVRMPSPTPACPMCHTPMLWEVDVARQQERWVCSRCPHAHAARPFATTRHAAGLSNPQAGAPHAIGDGHSAAPAPALALTQYTTLGPPPLPLRDGTNSALYVPLLLDAAGVLTPQAQLAWRSRAPFREWWPAAVDALRARPFIPVDELTSALQHVAQDWLSLPRSCNRLQRNVSGPGLTRGLAKSHPCPKLFARLPLHPRAITSQHRCRRCCLLSSLARRLSPPSRASLKRSVPSRSMRQVRSHTSDPAHRPTHQRPQPCTSEVMRRPRRPPLPLNLALALPALLLRTLVLKTLATTSSGPRQSASWRGNAAPADEAGVEVGAVGAAARTHASHLMRRVGPVPEADPPAPERSTASQRRVLSAEAAFHAGLQTLDAVDLAATLRKRVLTLQSVPVQVRSTLRTAFRAGLQLVADETSAESTLRGWKLFYLAARMLLHRAPAEARIPTAELERRCELFRRGEWPCLLAAAEAALRTPEADSLRASRTEVEARAARATALVHLGELSAAARALVSQPLAPGSSDTLQELRDPANRPQAPYAPPDPMLLAFRPEEQCALPLHPFLASLRTARRGSAAGPSGITNEHLRILLDDEADCTLLHRAAERLARADVPVPVVAAIRAGRIVALRKPNGRVRALVVGDVLRRLVGRTLAQEYASELQAACMPFQYGLSTRAGTEALVRLLRVATEIDPRATVLSIDAIGAFDHVSRHAMLAGLRQRPGLQPLLPYVRQFYASDSMYVWQDADGQSHEVRQSEGRRRARRPAHARFVRHRATPSPRSCSHATARGRGRLCLPRRHLCRCSSRAHPGTAGRLSAGTSRACVH